jgi:hypothetical protein
MIKFSIIALFAVLIIGCMGIPGDSTKTYSSANGSRLTISPISGDLVRGEVLLTFESTFSGPGNVNFVLSGKSDKTPLNMLVALDGKTGIKKLDTTKYENGPYEITVFAGNEAGEEDEIRGVSFRIAN